MGFIHCPPARAHAGVKKVKKAAELVALDEALDALAVGSGGMGEVYLAEDARLA